MQNDFYVNHLSHDTWTVQIENQEALGRVLRMCHSTYFFQENVRGKQQEVRRAASSAEK